MMGFWLVIVFIACMHPRTFTMFLCIRIASTTLLTVLNSCTRIGFVGQSRIRLPTARRIFFLYPLTWIIMFYCLLLICFVFFLWASCNHCALFRIIAAYYLFSRALLMFLRH